MNIKTITYLIAVLIGIGCICGFAINAESNTTQTYIKYPNHSIAVDPSVIPYGSHVLIDGHEYEAADCGGGIKGNRIDVYFASHQDACEFGVQYADVYLIKE